VTYQSLQAGFILFQTRRIMQAHITPRETYALPSGPNGAVDQWILTPNCAAARELEEMTGLGLYKFISDMQDRQGRYWELAWALSVSWREHAKSNKITDFKSFVRILPDDPARVEELNAKVARLVEGSFFGVKFKEWLTRFLETIVASNSPEEASPPSSPSPPEVTESPGESLPTPPLPSSDSPQTGSGTVSV
jgi:hypothetical protein